MRCYKTFSILVLLISQLILPEVCMGQGSNGVTCTGFQFALGSNGQDRAYDVAATTNNDFFVAGVTKGFGNADQILVSKINETGTVLWSKTYGRANNELIRKIKATADGGLLLVGQTTSFDNRAGEILCFKIDMDGNLLWTRKFGVGSQFGDLGMDIIETNDGGYALTGIINVAGMFADMTVIKLNNAANVVWAKRFDRGDGEDAVGILQNGDTLVVATDLMNANANYELHLMKLKLSDGIFISSKKLTPSERGLFNPYLHKNSAGPGYFVSGHTIDYSSYDRMNHTVIAVGDDFEIISTKLLKQSVYTNDYFTGFVPMPDGSFIGCASSVSGPDAYIYRVNADNSISYSKRINHSDDRRLSRLEVLNNKVIAVGSSVQGGNEEFYLASFNAAGTFNADCNVENTPLLLESPVYTASQFIWPNISDLNFQNTVVTLVSLDTYLQKTILCDQPQGKPLQAVSFCAGDSILLKSSINQGNVWSTGSTENEIQVFDAGEYWVRSLTTGGCYITDSFRVAKKDVPVVNLGMDTSICLNEQLKLDAQNSGANFSWNSGQSTQSITVQDAGQYIVAVSANGCVGRDSIRIATKSIPHLTTNGEQAICKDALTTLVVNGAEQYTWSPAFGLSVTTGTSVNASPETSTTYYVTGLGNNGCRTVDSVRVTVTPKPQFQVSSLTPVLCIGDTTVLSASGGDRYTWSPALFLSNPMLQTTLAYPAANTRYKVVIEEDRCRIKDSLFIDLQVTPKPMVKTAKSNDINCFVGQATLFAEGGVQYLWRPSAGLSDSTSNRPIVNALLTTTYQVFVTSAEGCTVQDSISVQVSKGDGAGYLVPSAFTPNADGKNDCFGVRHWGDVPAFSFQLYNRWGELVFKTMNTADCWNGYFKGRLQPDGAYVYLIRAKTMCGDVFRKGTFLLIR